MCGLAPDKRSQLGAHYTDREKIMLIGEPVIARPLLAEWEATKVEIGATVERAGAAKSAAARTRLHQQAERSLRSFLERLRKFIVLDPACGSGNFLYMALHALKDIEHRVQLEAETMGLQRGFPACDTRSHEYLSRRIRCSVIGTVPGRASGVTPRCEAPGTM